MKLRVDLDIDETTMSLLIQRAILAGYVKENERKAWTSAQKADACREGVRDLINRLGGR